jgi:hypothetical protein
MNKEIKELVIAQLRTMPENVGIAFGESAYLRDDLIKHVELEDKIGKQIVKVHMNFLTSFKTMGL